MDFHENRNACIAVLCGAAIISLGLVRRLLRKYQDLTNKVVLITGASSGIGEALATEFLRHGCRLILAARSVSKLEQLKQELLAVHRVVSDRVKVVYLDLADHPSIPGVARRCLDLFGRVDILINNAGIGCRGEVIETPLDAYKQVMDTNYFGQVALTKEILPLMISNGSGSIVAMSSLQGRFAIPFSSAYGASKHALQAFFDSLRCEMAKHNIHILVVSPSYVDTNFFVSRVSLDGSRVAGGDQQAAKIKGMTSKYVAEETVNSLVKRGNELALGPFHHRLMTYIRVFVPSLYTSILSGMTKSKL